MKGETRTSKVKGRDALIKKMQRQFGTRTISAQVGVKGTQGKRSGSGFAVWTDMEGKTVRDYRGSVMSPSRDSTWNLIVLRTQKKRGRNPVFTDKSESAEIQKMWTSAINSYMRGNKLALNRKARDIGQHLLVLIKRHIEEGRHIRGKLRKLKTRYAAEKKARWGDKPILEASGQLIDSFISDFKLIR